MAIEIKKINTCSFFTRVMAAAIDFSLAVVLSIFSSIFIYQGVKSGGKLKANLDAENLNVASSHLAKQSNKKYVTYTAEEYYEKTESGYRIIDALSHFYTVYLAGDEAKMPAGEIISENADEEMVVNDVATTPRALYTISWFNENVLKLPKEGQTSSYDYFAYQKDGENIDYTKVGTINEKYISDGAVNATDEMTNFIYEEYKKAVNLLYGQDYMVSFEKYNTDVDHLITFLCRLFFILVFFEIIPLCLKSGKSLGKLLMKASLVKTNGEPIRRWQVIPRGVLILGIPFALYFIPLLYVQIIVVGVFALASLILYLVNKESHMVLHDYIAQTVVAEDLEKTPQKVDKIPENN